MDRLGRIFPALALVLLSAMITPRIAKAEAYGSGWYGEVQATVGYENNISRTTGNDEPSDEIATLSIGGGHSQKLGDNAQLIVSAYASYTKHQEFEAIDIIAVALSVDYTVQLRAVIDAPWFNIRLETTDLNYRDSDAREGLLFHADLNMNRRLTTATVGHLGYRYHDLIFYGKSSVEKANDAVFDTSSDEVYVGLDYQIRPYVYLFGEYAFRHGDILSTLPAGFVSNHDYDAEALDPVFEAPCVAACSHSYAFRVRGDTYLAKLGLVFSFRTMNVDLTLNYFDARADNGRTYKDWLTALGIVWNF